MTLPEARILAVAALHKTANVFNDVTVSLALKDPNADVKLDDLGIDSLDKVEWCMEIEEQSGVKIDPALVEDCKTLSEVVRIVAAQADASAR